MDKMLQVIAFKMTKIASYILECYFVQPAGFGKVNDQNILASLRRVSAASLLEWPRRWTNAFFGNKALLKYFFFLCLLSTASRKHLMAWKSLGHRGCGNILLPWKAAGEACVYLCAHMRWHVLTCTFIGENASSSADHRPSLLVKHQLGYIF